MATEVMPSLPAAPSAFEFRKIALVAGNPNPFTGQEQVFAWSANPYFEGSANMPPMDYVTAQNWTNFITACNGPANNFVFTPAVCAAFPYELTYDGTNPRFWMLKGNSVSWSIRDGQLYYLTFEFREFL